MDKMFLLHTSHTFAISDEKIKFSTLESYVLQVVSPEHMFSSCSCPSCSRIRVCLLLVKPVSTPVTNSLSICRCHFIKEIEFISLL